VLLPKKRCYKETRSKTARNGISFFGLENQIFFLPSNDDVLHHGPTPAATHGRHASAGHVSLARPVKKLSVEKYKKKKLSENLYQVRGLMQGDHMSLCIDGRSC
jgi:hypothetical protein